MWNCEGPEGREERGSERRGLGRNLCTLTSPYPFWALKTPSFSFTEDLSRIACHEAPCCATDGMPTQLGQSTKSTIQQMDCSFPSQGIPVLSSCDFPYWSKAPEEVHPCSEPWHRDLTLCSSSTNLYPRHRSTRLGQEPFSLKDGLSLWISTGPG